MRSLRIAGLLLVCLASIGILHGSSEAKNPIRTDFFAHYSSTAAGTPLDALPSNSKHCGVCHYDFNGGGARNPYGAMVEAERASGSTNFEAFANIEGDDPDGDGFDNLTEITDLLNYANTPTFPGLSDANVGQTVNIPLGEISPYLTPTASVDTDPPTVTILAPTGGESVNAGTTFNVQWNASDPSDITGINVYFSDDAGTSWKPLALNLSNSGSWSWFISNLPGASSRIRVEATDGAGNVAHDDSADFTVIAVAAGYVPTTLRDMDLPGTQPLEGAILEDADVECAACHGNYDTSNEPWANWRGSMMSQAMRDPLFLACVAVAEQDAPSVGDLCIRCHSPGGWQEGRSADTSGGLINAKDRQGVQCDFCHRMVDYDYVEGTSPAEDVDVLAGVDPLPQQYANGQFINAATPTKRGPFDDALEEGHVALYSPFHRSADLCGTCHDVSNPVFDQVAPGDYAPNGFDAEHGTMDLRNMFPIERTFSEWSQSEYAALGVFAPEFAGNKADGIVSTCQDCHMPDANAAGSNVVGSPIRPDMPVHDLMGGNTFVLDILPDFYPSEVDVAQLQAAKARAISMLQRAATLELTPDGYGVGVRVINQTGHKLPSGYPEGRRVWLNVEAFDDQGQTVYTSGDYDPDTGVLTHDEDLTIYEIEPGLSPSLAGALGLPPGPSFHFVLNDTVYVDSRIPPRGFTNAGFEAIQSPPVAHSYEDGQYWDDAHYALPTSADSVRVRLYYQPTTKEYIEFLRDENTTNSAGQDLYDAWVAQGRAAPTLMVEATAEVNVLTAVDPLESRLSYELGRAEPTPFTGRTVLRYALPKADHVKIAVYDLRGRRVQTLVDEWKQPDRYTVAWDGRDHRGRSLASGVYFVRYQAGEEVRTQRTVLVR